MKEAWDTELSFHQAIADAVSQAESDYVLSHKYVRRTLCTQLQASTCDTTVGMVS